jgi:hypothetical protein
MSKSLANVITYILTAAIAVLGYFVSIPLLQVLFAAQAKHANDVPTPSGTEAYYFITILYWTVAVGLPVIGLIAIHYINHQRQKSPR